MKYLSLLWAITFSVVGNAQMQTDYSKLSPHLAEIAHHSSFIHHPSKSILALLSMSRPAMDVTPGQVNASPVYLGTDLPQAFTGKGVAAGVFDCHFDFTHPAFFDEEGQARVKYLYDFLYPNDDGSLGRAWDSSEEILALQHPLYGNLLLCGALVLLTGDGPAWMYSDLFLSPFTNVTGVPQYSHAEPGRTVSWPDTMSSLISVGATVLTVQSSCCVDLSHLPKGIYAVQLNTGVSASTGSNLIRF